MPAKPRRHRLLVYSAMLNLWWPGTLALCLSLWVLAAGLHWLPRLLPQFPFLLTHPRNLWFLAGAGAFALLLTLLLAGLRNAAWAQAHPSHLQLATPFLRVNISYRRILRTYSAEVQQLFPPRKVHGLRRDVIEPLAKRTALVIELKSLPLPRPLLRAFLSRFFFADRTPRLVLIVPDWMALSNAIDGYCANLQDSLRPTPEGSAAADLLAGLKKGRP